MLWKEQRRDLSSNQNFSIIQLMELGKVNKLFFFFLHVKFRQRKLAKTVQKLTKTVQHKPHSLSNILWLCAQSCPTL